MPFTPPSPDTLVDEAPPEQPQSRFTPPSPNAFVDEGQSQDAATALETPSHIPVTGRRQMADTIPTEQPATEQPVFARDLLLPGSGPSDLEFQGGFTKPVGDIVESGIWSNPVLPIPAHKAPAKSIPGAVLHAVDDAAAGVVNYLQSPQGLTEGAVAATPAAPIVLVKWARDMVLGAKHSLEEIGSEITQMLTEGINRQFVAQNKLGQLPPVDPAVMQGHVQAIANNVVQAAVMGLGAAGVTAHAAGSTEGLAKAAARSFEPPPAVKLAREINAAPGFDPTAESRAIQGGTPLTERIPIAQQSSTPPQVNNAIAAQLPPGEEISGVGRSTLSPAAEAALNDFLDNPVAKPPAVAQVPVNAPAPAIAPVPVRAAAPVDLRPAGEAVAPVVAPEEAPAPVATPPEAPKRYIYQSPNRPVLSISNYLPKGWELVNDNAFSLPEKLDFDQIKQWELVPEDPTHPLNIKKRFDKFKSDLMDKVADPEGDGVALKVTLKDNPPLVVTENIGDAAEVEKYPFRITRFTQDGQPSGHMTYRNWDEVVRALWSHADDITGIDNRKSKAKTPKPTDAPPEQSGQAVGPVATAPTDIESLLTTDTTNVEDARARAHAIDRKQSDLREAIKGLENETKALERLIKPQKGKAYTRSKIKKSAKQSDVARWRELQKQANDWGAQIQALDEAAKEDRRAVDNSVDAEIINDKTQPLLRRIDRKVRMMEGNASKELIAARDAEIERIVKEKYPDATPDEIAKMSPEVQRASYFSNKPDIWQQYGMQGGPDPHMMRRQAIDAAVNAPLVPKHLFPDELTERIQRFTKGNRVYGGKGIQPDAPIENPTVKEAADIVADIKSHTERIHEEQRAEAIRHAAEVKAEEAKSQQMMAEAQQIAGSAPKAGSKGGPTAKAVRTELVSRIKGVIDDLIAKNKTTVVQEQESGRWVATTDDKSLMAWGDIEPSGKESFKVTVKRPGGDNKTFTVKTMEEAQWIVKAMASSADGKAVIGVPGDGVFRLNKTGDTLLRVWNDARKLDVSSTEGANYTTGKGAEKPPGKIKTAQDWEDSKEYHGLNPDDKIYDWSPDLRVIAEKVSPEKPESVTAKMVDDWVERKRNGSPADAPPAAPEEPASPEEPQGAIATTGPQLAPSSPVPSKTPKSQRVIIADLAKGLKLPIRFGRLRTNKYAGYFLKVQNLIGSKKANDIPIVSHEVGHKLDAEFGFASNPALRTELDHLGDPSVPGSRSSWTPNKGNRYKLGEGVAEFVRHWLTDPPTARAMAPNTHAFFESVLNANKDFGDVMRQAQDDIQVWKTAEQQARLRSHISVGENPNKTRYTLSQLTRDLIDDLHFARLAVDDAEKYSGHSLAPSRNPYLLARNLRGSYGMADQFVRHGIADFNSRAVTLGTSLEDALKPVAGRMNDFRDWIVAKRAEELHAQGRNTGLVPTDVAFTAAKFNADPAFNEAFTKIKAWNDGLLKYAVDSGMVTPEAAKAMRQMNQDYVPFHRVFEIGAGESPAAEGAGTGRGLNVGTPASLRKMTGSPRDIVDPIETMVKNAYSLITASEKFAINRAVADLSRMPNMGQWVEHVKTPQQRITVGIEKLRKELEADGADLTNVPDDTLLHFFQNSGRAPFGENMISVARDGKPEFYRLKKELFETFHALNLDDAGTLLKALSSPAQLLRAGVTLAPDFALANAVRDAFSSAIISKHGLFPFEAALKGAAAMIQNPKLVAEWKASGGENAIEANYFDRTKLQRFLREKITKDLTPAEQALVVVKSPITALRWLTGTFEEITRIGEYKTAFEDLTSKGMPEGEARRLAAYESRDRQDFAKGGAKTKILRHATAFWNAQLQAQVKLFQAMKENPGRTALAGLAFITIPKLMEQAVNWNDKDYWDRPQWERDLFFLIPIGKGKDGHTSFLRIPTPFEPGIIFGTLPGRALQALHQKDPAALKSFPGLALRQGIPDPIPQAAQALFADFLSGKKGWDIWRGRTVVPESLAQLPPDMQWTEQTSLTAKKLGKVLNFSPMKIDHIIAQSTGGLGRQVVNQVADRAIEATGGGKRTAAGTVPGGRFFTTPAAVSSDSVEQFYATLDDLRTQIAGAKHGSKDPVDRQWASIFEARSRALGALRKVIRSTTNPDEKAAKQEQLLQLARKTMEEYRAAKAK